MLCKYIDMPIHLTDTKLNKYTFKTLTPQILVYLIILHFKKLKIKSDKHINMYIHEIWYTYNFLSQNKQMISYHLASKIHKVLTGYLIPYKVNKPRYRRKRLYINFNKWRALKRLTRKLKHVKPILPKTKKTNIRKKIKYTINPVQISFRKHYRNLRFKTKQKFNFFFKIWKKTAKPYLTGASLYKNTNPMTLTYKRMLLGTFVNYVLRHSVRKRLVKKFKRRLGIKQGSFIKIRCARLYHKWRANKTWTQFSEWNGTSIKNIFFKQLYVFNKLRKQKNTNDLSLSTRFKKSTQFSYRASIFRTLFNQTNQDYIYNGYITNLSLLNTTVTPTRYNRTLFEKLNRLGTDQNNYQTHTRMDSVSNYTPVRAISHILNTSSTYQYQVYGNTSTNIRSTQNMFFYVQYILTFLEKYTQKKIWLRLNTNQKLNKFWTDYCDIFNRAQSFHIKKLHKLINTQELLEIFVRTLITCDLKILLFYIKYKLENTHFKNHKKILSILFDTFKKNKAALSLAGVKGFSFDIRGKVGVAGNAKKRHLFFSIGKISTTSQNLKAQWQQINVWTPTGQMGVTCLIQY